MAVPQAEARPDPSADSVASSRGGSSAPRLGTWLLVALALSVLSYAGGMFHAWLRAMPREEQWQLELNEQTRQVSTALDQLQSSQAARAELERLIGVYEAYRGVEQALRALDARNFGIAESRLRSAESTLRALAPRVPEVREIEESVAKTSISVAADLAAQRAALSSLVAQLDAQLTVERGGLNLATDAPPGD